MATAVEIHFVLGNHVSIMVEPHVQILAEELKVCLEQARATAIPNSEVY